MYLLKDLNLITIVLYLSTVVCRMHKYLDTVLLISVLLHAQLNIFFIYTQWGKFISIVTNFQCSKPAIAVCFKGIPFTVPIAKEHLTSVIRSKNDQQRVTNHPMYFNGKRSKATVIYLHVFVFDDERRQKLLASMHFMFNTAFYFNKYRAM